MPNPNTMKHPIATVIEALRQSGGVVAIACEKLNISRMTYYRWEEAHPELKEARDEIKEDMLDLCEAGLISLIRDKDRESIRFYLRCHGKHRGWVDTMRVEGQNGGPIHIEQTTRVIVLPSNNREMLPAPDPAASV